MSPDQLTNLPASVKQRLLDLSRQTQVEFNVLLTKYALERFLYRLSVSRYRPQFIHFLVQANATGLEKDFVAVVEAVRMFVMPAARAAAREKPFSRNWPAGGPWQPQEKGHDG